MKSRVFCLLLVVATPAFAAISQVQSKANWSGGTASCAVTPTSGTTHPNLVVFWATWTSTSTLTAQVSDGFNTYLSAVGPTMQSATSIPTFAQLFYAKNITGTTNQIIVNFTGGSASASGCVFVEYSGLDTVAPLDSVSEAISNGGSPSGTLDSGTVAPANANLLLFGGGTSDAGSLVAGPLFTSIQGSPSGNSITEQQIVSGNTTLQRATAILNPAPSGSGDWLMQMAVFRGAIWTAAEGLSPIRIHSVRYADQFPGDDCGAKINAADADLASSPGEIWVNNNCGLAWITPVSISSGHVLRFIQGNTSSVYTLSCANPSLGCSTAGITLAANSSMVGPPIAMATNTTPVIELQMATTTPATNLPSIISVNGSFAAIRDIEIDGNSANNGSSGPNIVLNGAQRVDIDHVTSGKSNSDGVKLVGTSASAKISRLMTYQNTGNGLNCTAQSGDLIVSLSEFEANTGWGAVLFDCAGVRITGSDFGGNTAGGLLDESDGTANGGSNLILEATQFGNNTRKQHRG